MEVTIGGNRIGSGKKMKGRINNYYRSTHDLSTKFKSSMAAGVLYPSLVLPAMRGDSFDIDLQADLRTIPTVGPLFGSFKMQTDVYQVPVRLYQGILHNNPLAIGLKMNQVKFPVLNVMSGYNGTDNRDTAGEFSKSCLLKYLGMSGLGRTAQAQSANEFGRKINAIPALGYYDIYKTYYANKQEESGYLIGGNIEDTILIYTDEVFYWDTSAKADETIQINANNGLLLIWRFNKDITKIDDYKNEVLRSQELEFNSPDYQETFTLIDLQKNYGADIKWNDETSITLYLTKEQLTTISTIYLEGQDITSITIIKSTGNYTITKEIQLQKFKLANIDDMRYELLAKNKLGQTFNIDLSTNTDWSTDTSTDNSGLPYIALVQQSGEYELTNNRFPMNGLVIKTYQNDIYNNWLNTDWLEGENGINELSKVQVIDGAFSMDSLNFATKLYNMLNRIALAGATYEDWQDVVYEEVKRKQIESPIFCGGMSQEVIFDEIVQAAPTDGQPLGTLGGRGRLNGKQKGGKIHIKCDEACFIIAITSLTPRISYTQGNEFYMTDLLTMDDFHKPAMDGIGFQDLIGERLAWWDTLITPSSTSVIHRSKIGKLPAWIEYMTNVDRAYGDFAEEYGKAFMVLTRNYERDEETGGIKDATTYVDPSKYNYAFALQSLDAQNFWCEVKFDIKARRLMSARVIPNV